MLLSLLYEDWRSGLIVRPSTLSSRSRHKYYPRLLLLRFMLCKVDWTVRHACMVMICIIIRCEFSRCLCVIMEWVCVIAVCLVSGLNTRFRIICFL